MKHPEFLLLALLGSALAVGSPAGAADGAPPAACTCMSPKRPACEVWWQTSAIFVGRVTRIRTIEDESAEGLRTRKVATIRVAENIVGLPRREREVDVRTGSGGGDCGFDFQRDRTYLIYASRSARGGQLETGICSRTAPVEEAEADLAYLRGREEAPQVISLYGLVYRDRQQVPFGKRIDHPLDPGGSLAAVEVIVQGESGEQSTITDEEGWYEYQDLTVGSYQLRVRAEGVAEADTWGIRLPLAPACVWHDITVPAIPLESNAPASTSLRR